MSFTESRYKIKRPISELQTTTSRDGDKWATETRGVIYTSLGLVKAYAVEITDGDKILVRRSSLWSCPDGYDVTRSWGNKFYSERYLVTLANRFLNDLIKGDQSL